MHNYIAVLRDIFRLAFELWLKRIEEELQIFADALEGWLNDLFSHPRPDWRESFDQLLAEQEAEGRTPTPESRQDLLDYLEGWAATVDWSAVAGGPSGDARPGTVVAAAPESVAEIKARDDSKDRERFFHRNLAEANGHLAKIREILEALAEKLDAARLRQAVEIEAEADAIEDLIRHYNDAVQNARAAWLRGELSGDAYERLAGLQAPSDLHVPAFTDLRQAYLAKQQEEQIGQRLGRRTQALARILAAIEVLEGPAPGVLLPIGGGVVVTGVQTTGRWSVVMYVPSAKGFPYAVPVSTAGADTLGGLALASTIITWWLRIGGPHPGAPKPAPLPEAPKPPAPTTKAPPSPRPPRHHARTPAPQGASASRADHGSETDIRYNKGREDDVAVGSRRSEGPEKVPGIAPTEPAGLRKAAKPYEYVPGVVSFAIENPKLRQADLPNRVGSVFTFPYFAKPARLVDERGRPLCDKIGVIQTVKQTAEFKALGPISSFGGWYKSRNVARIDRSIPYPFKTGRNTISNPAKDARVYGVFWDEPGSRTFFFQWGYLTYLKQDFELHIVCLEGREKLATYGGVLWTHELRLTRPGLEVTEERIEYYSNAVKVEGPPTQEFRRAVLNHWSTGNELSPPVMAP